MFGEVSWNPDSTKFIYSGKILDEKKEYYWFGLFLFDMETYEYTLLGERWQGVWSPNGDWLAVYDDTEGQKKLFIMRPDGTDIREIDIPEKYTKNRIHKILWLPDSGGFYMKARLQWVPQKYALVYYDIESNDISQIFEFDDYQQYGWERMKLSPDGKWLILETNYPTSKWGIWSDFFVCNQVECNPIQPPNIFKCNSADWGGPYSISSTEP